MKFLKKSLAVTEYFNTTNTLKIIIWYTYEYLETCETFGKYIIIIIVSRCHHGFP